MSKEINLTKELARLLDFTASVACAIRMHSEYNKGSKPLYDEDLIDLMFLSDCLHNFNLIGVAIQSEQTSQIITACDYLLGTFESYQNEASFPGRRNAKATFERNLKYFSLRDAVDIFTAIKEKVSTIENAS